MRRRHGKDSTSPRFLSRQAREGGRRRQQETEDPSLSLDLALVLPSHSHDPSAAPSICARRSSIAVISTPWEATIADARART
jgi:hypothetical protein